MTSDEYSHGQAQMLLMASQIVQVDLASMLSWIDRSEAVGPILDPTLYRAACDRLQAFKELVQAGLQFQKAAKRVMEEWASGAVQP